MGSFFSPWYFCYTIIRSHLVMWGKKANEADDSFFPYENEPIVTGTKTSSTLVIQSSSAQNKLGKLNSVLAGLKSVDMESKSVFSVCVCLLLPSLMHQ